ncbi:MAG: COR domain-containing protein, partial [Planctomycetota bacterium]
LGSNGIGADGAQAIASGLPGLTSLDLGSNGIGADGAQAIASGLAGLTSLSLGSNRIGADGAQAIASGLAGLTSLSLGSNRIGDDGAQAIASGLAGLTSLSLGSNRIGDDGAQAIASGLPGLTSLSLMSNQISPTGLRHVLNVLADAHAETRLTWLDLRSQRVKQNDTALSEAINTTDAKELLAAWRRIREAESQGELQPLNEAKVLILGDESVGKSSLVRYLVHNKPCDPSQRKTPGIDIKEKIQTHKWSPDGSNIKLNIWDFGGQEIMHGTHRFFLTRRSIYLLVLEARREDQENVHGRVRDWLRTIRSRADDSPIIVVINKHEPPQELRLSEHTFAEEFAPVVGFFRTSCDPSENEHAEESIEALRQAIVDTAQQLPHVRDGIVPAWRRVKNEIADAAREQSVLERTDFIHICEHAEAERDTVTNEAEQNRLIGILDDLGVIVSHGRRIAKASAREIHLLDPNWLTKAIYTILNDQKIAHRDGVFEAAELNRILDAETYPARRHEFILDMMLSEDIELCYPVADAAVPTYLVPETLKTDRPYVGDGWDADVLRFRYRYEHLHRGVLPRFIVRTHRRLPEGKAMWRFGVVLEADTCHVLVESTPGKGVIDITVKGDAARRGSALRLIRDDLEAVHTVSGNLEAKALVPLPDQPELDVSYAHLKKLAARHSPDYLYAPEDADRDYTLTELLGPIDPHLVHSKTRSAPDEPQHPTRSTGSSDLDQLVRLLRTCLIMFAVLFVVVVIAIATGGWEAALLAFGISLIPIVVFVAVILTGQGVLEGKQVFTILLRALGIGGKAITGTSEPEGTDASEADADR